LVQKKSGTWCLFFPDEMAEQDHNNRAVSGIHRVQLFLGVGYNRREQLHRLAAEGVSVIFRIEEPSRGNQQDVNGSYYTADGRARIARQLSEIRQDVPGLVVEAAIAGNEPEIEYDLTRGDGHEWGNAPEANFPQGRLWLHQYAVGEMRKLLTPMGIVTVAPGWSHRRLTPRDAPEPGRQSWARACGEVYNGGPAGMHAYCHSYTSPEDENRLLWRVGIELERIQGEAWINEISVKSMVLTDVQRMLAVMRMYDLLAAQPWSGPIKSFCPFVSNGRVDQSWSNMIMRDPQCYVELGAWLAS